MNKTDYSNLEGQIGELGGESSSAEAIKPVGLGKLKHKASYGQKEDLSVQEQDEMDSFLERSKTRTSKTFSDNVIDINQGWVPINREEMGQRSWFYPKGWEFFIKPASVQMIKNWTSIDEKQPTVVNNVFNEIIRTCVKIDTHDINGAGWQSINSWDRFWFVLKIREYTFAKGESKVEFTDNCPECEHELTYTLESNSLFYEFPDDDLVEKYWTGRDWQIDPQEYDVDADPVTLYTPKLGKDEAIIKWLTNKVQNNQKVDENFIKFLVWMLDKPANDEQILDRQIAKLHKQYSDWSIDMFTFMNDVINNITINLSEKLKIKCPNCGQEVTSNVQFPDGIKVLFEVKSHAKKFGSR